jgi:RHS repeat-associated protein
MGSADYDAFQYDVNTGRLEQYQFDVGSPLKTDTGALTWNANGTLQKLAITDQLNSTNTQTCTLGYDDLVRVASASCGSVWSQTFTPDPFGNVTKTGSISFNPVYSTATNRYTSLPGLSYDNNGNLLNDSFHSYTWDSDANSLSIDSVTLTYDALDRMVEQNRSGAYTEIVYSPTGGKLTLMTGQTLQKAFVSLPGGATAVYNSSGLAYYRHSDWLGSSRLASTPSRTLYYDVAYAPYGESYAGSGTADLNFTGQNQDTVSGMYDFLYRQYHPVQGRWTSPDPAGLAAADPANPQSWNRYAYVANRPLSFIDPYGLFTLICEQLRNCAGQDDSSGGDQGEDADGGSGGRYDPLQNTGNKAGGGPAPNNSLKQKICSAIPSARTTGASGGVGGVGSPGGGGELVINYDTGQVSAFSFGGFQVGWNGGVSGSVYTGYVWGLNGSNSNYSGGFTGVNGGAGLGGFAESSSGGLTGGTSGLAPNGKVNAAGISFGGGLFGGFSGGVTATNYSKPAQLGKFWGFGLNPADWLLYAARQVCK